MMPGSNGIRSRRSSESVSLERCSSSVLKPQRSGKNDIPARRSSPKLRKRSYSRSSGGCRGRAGSDNSRSNSGHRRGSSVSSGSDSQNEKTHIRQSVSESRSPSRTKLPPHTTVPSSNTSRRSAVVTNLTRSVTGDHLREIFGLFGTIMDVQLMRDPIKSSRLRAVVTFENPEDVSTAIKHMDRGQIDGDIIRVTILEPPRGLQRKRSSESLSVDGRPRSRRSWVSKSLSRERRKEDRLVDYRDSRRKEAPIHRKRSLTPPRQRSRRPYVPSSSRKMFTSSRRRPSSPSPRRACSSDSVTYSQSPSHGRRSDNRKPSRSRSRSSWSSRSASASRSPPSHQRYRSRTKSRSISLDSTGRRRRRAPVVPPRGRRY